MRYRLVLILISLLVFGLVLGAVNSNAGSDPKFTLLVSQSIVDNGTIRLDAYRDDMLFSEPTVKHIQNGTIIEHDGHLYNYFPTGPSIFTLPIVAALRQSGMDMRLIEDSFLIQKILAAFTCVLMLWIVYKISRCFLDEASSVVISVVSVLGTTIISTMGTALWTINFSTIFIALSLLLLARYETKKSDTAHPIFLGILFFLAFFSRPSAAAFIVAALAYLLVKERRQFLVAASASFLLLILFTAWSRLEYGLWQPPYYSIARLQAERVSIWIGLIGNLISPSRGIFVFSPFFLLIIPGVLYVGRKLIRQPLMWMAVSWFVLSLILNARAVVWWGGLSFGPRLLTENVLALVLLVILIWKEARLRLRTRVGWTIISVFAVLGLIAIFINSYQGLFNPDTHGWNLFIEPRAVPPQTGLGDIFDWSNPQFLATAQSNCEFGYKRFQEILPYDSSLETYQWEDPIWPYADQTMDFRTEAANEANWRFSTVAASMPEAAPPTYLPQVYLPVLAMPGNKALLVGWQVYDEQKAYRVSICPEAQIFFKLDDVSTSGSYELALSFGALGEQEVRVFVNGTKVDALAVTNPIDQPQQFTIPFDGMVLKPNSMNELSFEFPSAVRPNPRSYQLSAVGYYSAAIYPAGNTPKWLEPPNQEPISAAYP